MDGFAKTLQFLQPAGCYRTSTRLTKLPQAQCAPGRKFDGQGGSR